MDSKEEPEKLLCVIVISLDPVQILFMAQQWTVYTYIVTVFQTLLIRLDWMCYTYLGA